jgi:hypothetical protein
MSKVLQSDVSQYKALLVQISELLLSVGDKGWGPKLQAWAQELEGLSDSQIVAHARATNLSLAGMGAIGDVIICPENGHTVAADQVHTMNSRFMALVESLYSNTNALLGKR